MAPAPTSPRRSRSGALTSAPRAVRRGSPRPARASEGVLIAEDLALEGGLLDVARRRGDAALLQPPPELGRAARDLPRVDAQAVLPVDVLVVGGHPGRLDAAHALEEPG